MRHTLLLLTAITATLVHNTAYPAAFQFYELGTPVIGTAGVGQAALAYDASITYFNPAGMTQLNHSQYMLGSQLVLPEAHFSKNSRNTISGDNGGNAGTLTPGLDLYYLYHFSPKLDFGVNLTTPYAGMLTYNDGWVGRYVVQTLQLLTLDINPVVAYRFNDCLSVGGGFTVEYASLHQTVALPILPLIDGQANIKVHNTAVGGNIGILFTPCPTTKIGVAYRSQIKHHLHGNTSFFRLAITPATSTQIIMPQNIIASIAQDINQQMVVLGELGWANWSTMHNDVVNIAGFTATTHQDWRNTYRVGLGGQYKLTPALLLQTGASYDSSPTRTAKRLPNLPMDRQIRLGTGIIYTLMNAVQLGFSYEHVDFGKAKIRNTTRDRVLSGSYAKNFANIFQASINISC